MCQHVGNLTLRPINKIGTRINYRFTTTSGAIASLFRLTWILDLHTHTQKHTQRLARLIANRYRDIIDGVNG